MKHILVVPLHSSLGTVIIPMARYIGPHRIFLVHPWNEDGEADRNCKTLAEHFTVGLKKESRTSKTQERRGNIKKNTPIDVIALAAYTLMEDVSQAFRDFLINLSNDHPDTIIHLALLDEIPMAYAIAAFSVSAVIPIRAYTAQIGYDIRRQHPTNFQPGLQINKTIREIPLLNQISDCIRWLNSHDGPRAILSKCYLMLSQSQDIRRSFKTREVVNFTNYRQSRISNHLKTMCSPEGMNLVARQEIKTNYRLTELGQTVAPFILDKVPKEASQEDQ